MRATVMHKAGDVRIETVPDAAIREPTDALIRVTRACICGSDLWPYNDGPNVGRPADGPRGDRNRRGGRQRGRTIRRGEVVVMPFAFSDGTCLFCEEGLQTACVHGGFFGNGGEAGGAQAEALRIPQADGTLFPLDVGEDDALMPSLLTLADVMGTGHHAAVTARVAAGTTSPWSATAPSACAGSLPPGGSAPGRSSSWAATRIASTSPGSMAPPTSSASAATRRSRGCAS